MPTQRPSSEVRAEQLVDAYWLAPNEEMRDILFDAIVDLERIAGRFESKKVRQLLDFRPPYRDA